MIRTIVLALALTAAGPPAAQDDGWAQTRAEWNRPTEPFRVADNLYYVGTAGLSAWLLTSPQGHILIDGGLAESVPLIEANIAKLGFRLRDVKILLINHAHFDHAAGLAALKRDTGARLLASAGDKAALEAGGQDYRPDLPGFDPVKVDGVLREGQEIRLGGNRLVTLLTPGHTKGCTSWSARVTIGGQAHDALFLCSITVADQPLVAGKGYDEAARDFRATFAKLRGTKADVLLSFHPGAFDMDAKRAALAAGNQDAFVDPGELGRRVDAAEVAFDAELKKQQGAAQ